MHPAVFDGVTNREERNGGAYSNTKRLTMSNTKILSADQQRSAIVNEGGADVLTQRNIQRSLSPGGN